MDIPYLEGKERTSWGCLVLSGLMATSEPYITGPGGLPILKVTVMGYTTINPNWITKRNIKTRD